MGALHYAILTSLDGYIADAAGNFDWAEPQEDVHRFINKLEKENSVFLLGKNMYQILRVWENLPDREALPDYIQEYEGVWKKARKIVYSASLTSVDTSQTSLRRSFDKNEIADLKRKEKNTIGIGGAALASQALFFELIDEIYLFTFPVLIGSGKKWITTEKALRLKLLDAVEFASGIYMTHYKVLYANKESRA
ncbi:MAG: hypothetical protein A2Y38_24375 [Spirochaetes bacterium GWB1_59_5]|nr:MAG: hypothetical protein A2Y38_24375 [Spirochaetes bacterium GWB1_59_5]